jgi:hypothetical protein
MPVPIGHPEIFGNYSQGNSPGGRPARFSWNILLKASAWDTIK